MKTIEQINNEISEHSNRIYQLKIELEKLNKDEALNSLKKYENSYIAIHQSFPDRKMWDFYKFKTIVDGELQYDCIRIIDDARYNTNSIDMNSSSAGWVFWEDLSADETLTSISKEVYDTIKQKFVDVVKLVDINSIING